MNPVARYTELAFWSVVPGVMTIFFILLHNTPKYVTGFSEVMPMLHLGVMYYWVVHRPREIPYWFACLAGVLFDSICGLPLGLSSMLYIIFVLITLSQIRHIHKEGFAVKWLFFSMLTLVLAGLQWLLMLVLTLNAYPLGAPLLGWLTTIGCYPLLHLLCDRVAYASALRRWHHQHVK